MAINLMITAKNRERKKNERLFFLRIVFNFNDESGVV